MVVFTAAATTPNEDGAMCDVSLDHEQKGDEKFMDEAFFCDGCNVAAHRSEAQSEDDNPQLSADEGSDDLSFHEHPDVPEQQSPIRWLQQHGEDVDEET